MPRLSQRDLQAVLEYLRTTYETLDLDAFRRQAVAGLLDLVPSAFGSYNEIEPKTGRVRYVVEPSSALVPNLEPVFAQQIQEHPVLAHFISTRDGSPRKISDFLTRSEFHRLGLYNNVYRRTGVEYQMCLMIHRLQRRPPVVAMIALDRDRGGPDYSERDRFLLSLLGPHLIGAYGNARAVSGIQRQASAAGMGCEAPEREIVVLGRDGPQTLSIRARRWLKECFGDDPLRDDLLPDLLQRWIRIQQASWQRGDTLPLPRTPFVTERPGRRLSARLIPGSPHDRLILEDEQTGIDHAALERLGLTPREAEVLRWVTEGKTNPEIGAILGTSPRTVGKHLERIYAKLDVNTRTAAAVRALGPGGSC